MVKNIKDAYRLAVISLMIAMSTLLLTTCKNEDDFRDYTETESYNSSIVIEDITHSAEIFTAKDGIKLIDYKHTVYAGEYTSLTLKLDGDKEYSIEVEYTSGISQSKALVPKVSDQNGYVTWRWQVGTNCKSGKYPVRIYKDTELVFESRLTVK